MLKQADADCKRAFAAHCYNRPFTKKPLYGMHFLRAGRLTALVIAWAALAGCASGPRQDPLEPLNRAVFNFNDTVDNAVTKPAAKGYRDITPDPVRIGVLNFFGNFRDVVTTFNDVLQLKMGQGANDAGRVAINSTIGFFGVFDVATRLGLEKHRRDFGQTLGVWGWTNSTYLVLPFLGPSTTRDAIGWVGDYFMDPEFYLFTTAPANWIVFGTNVISYRATLLGADEFIQASGVDKYIFLRDGYLQIRRNQIYDGNPPPEPGAPRRKTLKEQEEELELEDKPPDSQEPPPR
jgi:phospholipid-binding lipoprotein MlaA